MSVVTKSDTNPFALQWNNSDVIIKVTTTKQPVNKNNEIKRVNQLMTVKPPTTNQKESASVEEPLFHVHSVVLSLASPVFERMLQSDFKEGREKIIELPNQNMNDVLILLKILYPMGFKLKGRGIQLFDETETFIHTGQSSQRHLIAIFSFVI